MKPDDARIRTYITDAHARGIVRLPPEPKLSEELQISRGRLRTLLKKAEDEGLIWRHVGKGTFVGARQHSPTSGDVATSTSVSQLIQARLVLEPQLAAQAAMNATASDLSQLENCVDQMDAAVTFDEFKTFDDRLHRLVAEATHNALLVRLYETLKNDLALHLHSRMASVFAPQPSSDPQRQTNLEHRAFVDAIKDHDPRGAERLMRAHLISVRDRLFGDG